MKLTEKQKVAYEAICKHWYDQEKVAKNEKDLGRRLGLSNLGVALALIGAGLYHGTTYTEKSKAGSAVASQLFKKKLTGRSGSRGYGFRHYPLSPDEIVKAKVNE